MADDSLIREVNDAVRHDQMVALWKQYRTPLFAIAAALVLATAGSSIWSNYRDSRGAEAMQAMSSAQALLVAGSYAPAAEAFAKAGDDALTGESRDLAHLWQARALQAANEEGKAIAVLEKLATKPEGKDPIWSDMACLRLVGLDATKTTCLNGGESPLANERQLVRAANLWQAGKDAEAAEILRKLAHSVDTPEPVRNRANHYLSVAADGAKAE
jgi:hypothetical protein